MSETEVTPTKKKINCHMVLLDKSGSMSGLAKETVSGFNEQVQMVKDLSRKYPNQEFLVSLITFNHEVEIEFFNAEAEKLEEISEANYTPDGRTALWDAVGQAVNKMQAALKKDLKDEDVQVSLIIFTDGLNNASQEFHDKQFVDLMSELRKDKKWIVQYIGANHDVEKTASQYGIKQAVAFDYSNIGTKAAMRAVSATMRKSAHYRNSGVVLGSSLYENLVDNTYKEAYDAEVKNMNSMGIDASAVWTAKADAEEAEDKKKTDKK